MADEIKIKVGVQSGVKDGMRNVSRDISDSVSGVKSALGMLGIGFGFGAIVSGAKSLISSLGELKDKAEQVDFSTTNYQKLAIVASESGLKADELSSALGRMIKMQESIADDKKAQEAFQSLGISIEDVMSSRPEDLFEKIAKGLDETGNKSVAFDIFGRGAAKLIPTLANLKNGFEEISRGGIVKDEDLAKLDALDEKIAAIGRTLKSWLVNAGSWVVDKIESAAAALGAWSAGGTLDDARQSRRAPDDTKAQSAKREKEAQDKINSEKKLSEYRKKLASDDDKWRQELWDIEDQRANDAFNREVDRHNEIRELIKKETTEKLKGEKEATEEQLKNIERISSDQQKADAARRDRLQAIMDANAWGVGAFNEASTSSGFAAARKRDRQEQSQFDREVRQAQQAQARMDKGVATDRDIALLGAMEANAAAKAARDEMVKMDKDAKQAAIDTAKNTRILNEKLDIIEKTMTGIARG